MTDKEKAIVMAHTGICMLAGNKFQIFHKYVEDIMNRPIMTHEIGLLADEIKEKSKADFMALCANENNVEEEQELILEKIRAEIEQTVSRYSISRERGGMGQVEWSDFLIKQSEVLKILDKYKTKSEET